MKSPETVIDPLLESGETLKWTGVPGQGLRFSSQDLVLIPFSLAWAGFSFFWEGIVLVMLIKTREPFLILMALFGIPFVLVGYFLLAGRFISDRKDRENTFYGVTDRRVIIVRGKNHETVTSIPFRELSAVRLVEHSDRTGTVHFDKPVGELASGLSGRHGGRKDLILFLKDCDRTFRFISNPKDVYNILMQILNKDPEPGRRPAPKEDLYRAPDME